jgi:hypothetical protein
MVRLTFSASLGCLLLAATSACATKAASLTTVTICGSAIAILDVSPPADSGPVVLMAAPCLLRNDATPVIPQAYRRYIQLQASRPLDGVWVPYDERASATMEADYRRLWDTGRLSDLTFSITDYTFPNGVIGKFVTYTITER